MAKRPRQCIGSALATMKMQVMVAMIAQRYRVRIAPGRRVEADAGTSLRPRGGMWVKVTPRT